jgi:hypothetical protein
MFTHIVMLRFQDANDATEAQMRLLTMASEMSLLMGLEVGVDVLRESRSYDLALVARLQDQTDLPIYQNHPAHQAFLAWARPRLQSSVAVDYPAHVAGSLDSIALDYDPTI